VALRSGATSASDLLTAATRRMGATRHLNAFIGGVLPRAIERAEASDERRRSRARSASRVENETKRDDAPGATTECSHVPSLLDGVPIAVKDNFFVPGAPTTAGSNVLRDFVAPDVPGAFESTVTRRLARRGAVLFAKTNMDEFGMGSANAHSAFGAAVNPWTRKRVNDETDETDETDTRRFFETTRVPGGSSGGSAVAVASGVAVAAVGSDTGGSARLPASYCGVVGFKPTYGRVSRWGLVPYCSSLDCPGFLTRTVADAVLMLDATQGRDALDPATLVADERVAALARDVEANVARRAETSNDAFEKTEAHTFTDDGGYSRDRGYLRSKPGFPLAGWRVGIPNEYFVSELSDETARAWMETADACERAGASVIPVSLPHTRAALAAYYVIAPAEASSNLARYDGVRFGYRPRSSLSKNLSKHLSKNLSSSPFANAATAFRGAAFGAETRRRVLVGTFVSGSKRVARYVEKAQKVRRAVSDDFRDAFAKVDILLVPTAPSTAPPLFFTKKKNAENSEDASETDASLAAYAADAMTVPASLAGLPAVSLPVGLGTETGLPVGVQVIAARGNDADALGFAMRLEARVEALGDRGGGAGPEAAADGKAGAVGWGERHRAVGVLEATRFAIGG